MKNNKPSKKQHCDLKKDLAYIKSEINNMEKKWKKNSFDRTVRISNKFDIPEDVFSCAPIVTAISNLEIRVENYGRVCDYSETCIELNTGKLSLKIIGNSLKVTCYTEEEIIVKGKVSNIAFCGQE